MFCLGCNEPNSDSATVCRHCGKSIVVANDDVMPSGAVPTSAVPIAELTVAAGASADGEAASEDETHPSNNWFPSSTEQTHAVAPDPAMNTEASRAPRSRLVRMVAIAAALIGVGAVASAIASAFTGSDGASSPEAAVEDFAKAVGKQDAVAVIGALNPGEVHDVGSVYKLIRGRLDKAGVKHKEDPTTEAAVLGFRNFRFNQLKLSTDKLSGDVARVNMVSGSFDFEQRADRSLSRLLPVSLGVDTPKADKKRYIKRSLGVDKLTYTAHDRDGNAHKVKPFLMVVKRDGGWYVSIAYSAAEEIVASQGKQSTKLDLAQRKAAPAVKTDTPERAVRAAIDAVETKDLTKIAPFLSDDELRALRDYGPLFQTLLNDRLRDADSFNITVDRLELTSTHLRGDLYRVEVDGLDATLAGEGKDDQTASFDGECLRTNESKKNCISKQVRDMTGINKVFVVMRRHDGRYTLSPVATLLEYARTLAKGVPDAVIQRLTNNYDQAPIDKTVSIGASSVSGTTNVAGFAVMKFTGRKEALIAVNTVHSDSDFGFSTRFTLSDPSGKLVTPLDGGSCFGCVYKLPANGDYRISVANSGFSRSKYSVLISTVENESVRVPFNDSIKVGKGTTKGLRFTVPERGFYLVEANADSSSDRIDTQLVSSKGRQIYCFTACRLSPGEYTLFITASTVDLYPDVQIRAQTWEFEDGGLSTTGTLSGTGDSQTFTVNSVEGERAEIVVTPSDGVDVAIEVSNDSSTVDERITGGVETFSFLADSATIRVTVTSASGAGSFSIKLTPGNGL